MLRLRSLTVERLVDVGRVLVPTNAAARCQPRPVPGGVKRRVYGARDEEHPIPSLSL